MSGTSQKSTILIHPRVMAAAPELAECVDGLFIHVAEHVLQSMDREISLREELRRAVEVLCHTLARGPIG
jgi:hypothetical protein